MRRFFITLPAIVMLLLPACTRTTTVYETITNQTVSTSNVTQELAETKEELARAQDTIIRQQANLDEFAKQVTNAAEQRNAAYQKVTQLQWQVDAMIAKQVPTLSLNIYVDPARTILVKTGEEFIIRYDLGNEIFITAVDEFHEEDFIHVTGMKKAYHILNNDLPGVAWFTFKAVKPGETQITISHMGHLGIGPVNPQTFNVVITD
jgi:hypothetical protein